MNKALFAGSFDPYTTGHHDILVQASKIFDEVIVAVAYNSEKKGFLTIDKRLEIIIKNVSELENVSVDSYEGLTVEYAKKNNINVLIRGIRNSLDFEYEMQIADTNKMLAPEITTLFLTPKPENAYISSSMVRDVYTNGGDVSKFVSFFDL